MQLSTSIEIPAEVIEPFLSVVTGDRCSYVTSRRQGVNTSQRLVASNGFCLLAEFRFGFRLQRVRRRARKPVQARMLFGMRRGL